MAKKYIVTLTSEERIQLEELVKRGKTAAYRIKHAHILLNSDSNNTRKYSDVELGDFLGCHSNTVFNVRQRFVEGGLEAALERKQRETPPRPRKLDGVGEAHLLRIACSEPPEGRSFWTLKMLGDALVELKIVDGIAPETVRQTLKKTILSPIYANVG
jgi:hypothetical protein